MYQQIQAEIEQGRRGVRRLCAAVGLSRAGYYRHRRRPKTKTAEEVALQDQIQRIALEMGFYGYRRVRAALQQEGWRVNGSGCCA